MKISVTLGSSQNTGHATFTLDDINVSQQEWEEMDAAQKKEAVEQAVNNLPEHPYWMVDSFTEL